MGEGTVVCPLADLATGKAQAFEVGDRRLALVRIEDEVFALDDRCSHEDYSLSEGDVYPEECEIECWKHGSTFDLRTGAPQCLPATQPVATYPVRVEGGQVVVELP
jgi:3-phenylpropionate/trans-cinnamate dioxygenase ferredoxin subunit